MSFGPRGPVQPAPSDRSLVRFPDGSDSDNLCRDFTLSALPTPGAPNTVPVVN